MRFLVIEHLKAEAQAIYSSPEHLGRGGDYEQNAREINDELIGAVDSFGFALNGLGHDAPNVLVNCLPLQRHWATEHGLRVPYTGVQKPSLFAKIMGGNRPAASPPWVYDVLFAQAEAAKPDVLLLHDPLTFPDYVIDRLRPTAPRIVGIDHGAVACPKNSGAFDMIVSPNAKTVEALRSSGAKSDLLLPAFDERARSIGAAIPKSVAACYVASQKPIHAETVRFLNRLADYVPLSVWGPPLPPEVTVTALGRCYRGRSLGADGIRALAASKISIHHASANGGNTTADCVATAAGLAALVLTNAPDEAAALYRAGTEFVPFTSAEDCTEKVLHFIANEAESAPVAAAAQKRTLAEHTYQLRAGELCRLIEGLS